MGFEEVQHTADWSVRVWGSDLPDLFAESARATNALSGLAIGPGPRATRRFRAEGPDVESLLVSFLSELVYLAEQEALGFDTFEVGMPLPPLSLSMQGGPILRLDKAIKAVTWHDLKIVRTERGLETIIVFDV